MDGWRRIFVEEEFEADDLEADVKTTSDLGQILINSSLLGFLQVTFPASQQLQ